MHARADDTEFFAAVSDGLSTDAEERLEFDQLTDRDGPAVLADLSPQDLRRDKKGAAEAKGGLFFSTSPGHQALHGRVVGDR